MGGVSPIVAARRSQLAWQLAFSVCLRSSGPATTAWRAMTGAPQKQPARGWIVRACWKSILQGSFEAFNFPTTCCVPPYSCGVLNCESRLCQKRFDSENGRASKRNLPRRRT